MKTKMSIPQKIWAYVKGNPIVVMMALVSLIVGCTINKADQSHHGNNGVALNVSPDSLGNAHLGFHSFLFLLT